MTQPDSLTVEAKSLLDQGQLHYFAEPPNYVEAERCFREAITFAPKWGEPYHFLASSLHLQGKLAEAQSVQEEAVRLLPGDPRPLLCLGEFLLLSGRYTEAASAIEEVLTLKPHYTEAVARLMLAEVYEKLGRIDEAIASWRKILTIASSYPSYDTPKSEASKKLAEYDREFRGKNT